MPHLLQSELACPPGEDETVGTVGPFVSICCVCRHLADGKSVDPWWSAAQGFQELHLHPSASQRKHYQML